MLIGSYCRDHTRIWSPQLGKSGRPRSLCRPYARQPSSTSLPYVDRPNVPAIKFKEMLSCWTSTISRLAAPFLRHSRFTLALAIGCEEVAMIEPLIGLVLAVCLSVYLLITLLKPEWF